jgi:hypothetical protein
MSNTTRLRVEVLEGREVPAGDLASALQLTGLPAGTNLRVASDLVGNTIVAGTFTGSIDLDPSTTGVATVTAQGASDVFVAKYGSDGKLVWARDLGGTGSGKVADLATFTSAAPSPAPWISTPIPTSRPPPPPPPAGPGTCGS